MPAIVVSNLFSNFFWLSTIVLYWVAWILQMGGLSGYTSILNQAVTTNNNIGNNGNGGLNNIALGLASVQVGVEWFMWTVQPLVLLALMVSIMSTSASSFQSSLFGYRLVYLSFFVFILAVLVSLCDKFVGLTSVLQATTSVLPATLPTTGPAAEAIARLYQTLRSAQTFLAGLIISCIILVLWIIALGSDKNTVVAQIVYTTCARTNDPNNPTNMNSKVVQSGDNLTANETKGGKPKSLPTEVPDTPSNDLKQVVTSNQLAAEALAASKAPAESLMKAKALYNYTASPDDPTEVSFSKGEVFVVLDNKGKWWQVQKDNGTTGIAPSNYLELLR